MMKALYLAAAVLAVSLLSVPLLVAQKDGTPIIVGDGSIRIGPKSALDTEFEDAGSGNKRSRGRFRIRNVRAAGAGAINSANPIECPRGESCTLVVVYRASGSRSDFAVVTVTSDRRNRGLTIASSVPWDDFETDGENLAKKDPYRVVWAGFNVGNTSTQICRERNGATPTCTITINTNEPAEAQQAQ